MDKLVKLSKKDVKKDELYRNATKEELERFKELITDENGVPKKGKIGIFQDIETKIKNIED